MKKLYQAYRVPIPVVFLLLFPCLVTAQSSVIISQYIETNSGTTPKGIEVFNVSGADITFTASNNLRVFQGTNGGSCSALVNITSGTLQADAVWVIGTSDLTGFASTNGTALSGTTTYGFTFNGDDALQLWLGSNLQDVFGSCGTDPGSAWSGGGVSTANQNIQVLDAICDGAGGNWTDPSIRFEYVAGGTVMTGFGNAPASCSVPSCNLTSAGLDDVACDQNGTPANGADDRITFELAPTGTDLGATYSVSVSSGSVSPNSGIAYGSSVQFTMNAGSAGAGNVTVTITDDTDLTCTINAVVTDPGTCVSEPDIQLQQPVGSNQACGFTYDYGSVNTGSDADVTVRVRNDGLDDLNISSASLSGPDAAEFSVVSGPAAVIAPGGFSDVVLRFSPASGGSKSAQLSLVSDDPDEIPCTVNLEGEGVPACAAPSGQPIILTFPAVAEYSIDGSFQHATPVSDGYLVVVSTSSSLSTNPVDGVAYAPGDPLGGGEVVQASAATAFSASGLSAATTYYFFIFAFSDVACHSGPAYLTAAPLTGNATTLNAPCVYETFSNIGNSGSYGTINWTGDDGDTWTATDARSDQTINGKAILIRNGHITTPTFPDGISSITLSTQREFAGGSGTLEVRVNGSPVGTVPYDGTVQTSTISGIDIAGNIVIEIGPPTGSGDRVKVDDLSIFCFNGPEISVTGNGLEIPDGDVSPAVPDGTDFGSSELGTGPVLQTFYIHNTGSDTLVLTGVTPFVSVSPATHFTLSGIPAGAIAPGDSTAFSVAFEPLATGTHTATVSVANNDPDEDPYTFLVTGTGTYSALSDVVPSAGFTYSSDIDYTAYQGNPITNTSMSVGVMRLTVRDGGPAGSDADIQPTVLTGITFQVAELANVRSAALFDGNALIANNPVINYGAGTLAFSGLSGTAVTAPDGGTRDITLRVSFLTTVTDNAQLQFTVSSVTADPAGSVFADADGGGAVSSTSGNRNRIEVTATELAFSQQPSTTTVNAAMTPAVAVRGADVNGNFDFDWAGSVSLSSSGTMTGDPLSSVAVAGIAAFPGIVHTAPGDDLIMTASCTGFTDVVSGLFNIVDFSFLAGDFRPLYATDFSYNGDWEYFDGSSWGPVPDGNAPQNTAVPIARILVDDFVTGGGNTTHTYDADIVVMQGGTLELNDDDNPPVAAPFLTAGHSLEVLDGGFLIVRGDIDLPSGAGLIVRNGGEMIIDQASMTNDHPMWNGTELFESNSTLTINDWDWSAAAQSRSLINVFSAIDDNGSGYKFGHVVFDASPAADWTIVGGPLNVNVTEGDFTIINASANAVNVMTNRTAGISATFGGDILVTDGAFSFSGTYNNDAFNHLITILGDFENTAPEAMYLHRTHAGTPSSIQSDVFVAGNVTVNGPPAFSSNTASGTTDYELHFNGTDSQYVHIAPPITQVEMIAEPGAFVLMSEDPMQFAGNTALEILGGATWHFHFDASGDPLYIDQTAGSGNTFTFRSGAYTYITDPGGLWASGSTIGNVRNIPASNRSIANSNSTFHYIGRAPQQTGDCHTAGSTTKKVIVELEDNAHALTLTNTTGTSDELRVISGVFTETDAAYIYGSGQLHMTGGGFRSSVLTPTGTVPLLTGDYSLTGGFVELNAAGDQTLRGSSPTKPSYYDVIISGSNTAGADDKTVTSAFVVDHRMQVTGSPIFDIASNGMTGAAGLTMDGGRLRMSKLSTSLPELEGTATAYAITGGTVEWYGTNASQNQLVRGVDANLSTISYHHIDLNAVAANTSTANVNLSEGIIITGDMRVYSPTVFQMDNTDHVDGSGSFYVLPGATYKYGDEFGITLGSSTALTAGAIRTSSARTSANFSSDASYGWVSSGDMVTGDALPASIVNAYLQRNATTDNTTLTNDLTIRETLRMERGNLRAETRWLELGQSTAQTGYLDYDATHEPFVIGALKRWFGAGTNSGYGSGLFPLGMDNPSMPGDVYNRFTLIEYSAPKVSGGSLTVGFFPYPMGYDGLPINGIAAAGACPSFNAINTEDEGYWVYEDGDGLDGGSYTITNTGEGFQNISDICQLTLLKRVNGGNWFENGAHLEPFYLDAPGALQPTLRRAGASGWSNWGFSGGLGNPLPVELLTFEARRNGQHAALSWSTASEINSDYFEIEHSRDGARFEALGRVGAAGWSSEVLQYGFTHFLPGPGLHYYRLRQTDLDGSFEYSVVRAVDMGGTFNADVDIYAANGVVHVQTGGDLPGAFYLYNYAGQLHGIYTARTISGNVVEIVLEGLATGVYLLKWQSGGQVRAGKFFWH